MRKRERLSALLRSAAPSHSPLRDAVDAVVATLDPKNTATPSDGVRSRRSTSQPRVVIDFKEYPHLVGRVIAHADLDALLLLRSTCRILCERISGVLFGHVVLEAAYDVGPPSPDSEGDDCPPLRGKWVRSSLVRSGTRITMLPNYPIPTELPPSCAAVRPRGRAAVASVWTNPHLLRLLSHARTVDLLVSRWWLDPHSVLSALSGARTLRMRWDNVPLRGPDQLHSLELGPRRPAPLARARRHARTESAQLDPLDFARLGPLGRLERVIIAASGAWDWIPVVAVDRSETVAGRKCTAAVISTVSESVALELPLSAREVIIVLHSTSTPKQPEFPIVLRSTLPARGRASSSSAASQIDSTPPTHTADYRLSANSLAPTVVSQLDSTPMRTPKADYRLSANSLAPTIVTSFDKPALAADSLSPHRASLYDQQRASYASSMVTLVGTNVHRPDSPSLFRTSLDRPRSSMEKTRSSMEKTRTSMEKTRSSMEQTNRGSWSGRGTHTTPPMEELCNDLSPDDAAFVIM